MRILKLSLITLSLMMFNPPAIAEQAKSSKSSMTFAELCMDQGGTWVGSFKDGHCDNGGQAQAQLETAKQCLDEGRVWHGSFENGRCGN